LDAKVILDNLLDTSQRATKKGLEIAEQKLGVPESGEQRDVMLEGLGKGAVGGVAAVGGIAYKAYTEWQKQQQSPTIMDTGTPIAELEEPEANTRSEAIVKAMISAAKSDGHVDGDEQKLITAKIESLGIEQEITSFLMKELSKPLDVAEVVASADSPETAAEIYLASTMVVDLQAPDERAYMDSLAAGLGLDAELVKELESKVT